MKIFTYNNFWFLDSWGAPLHVHIFWPTYQTTDFGTKMMLESCFFNLDYRNFVWIHVFFTMDRIINANRWISLWSPVDKKRYIVSIISRRNGLVFVGLCNLPCHWMSTTSCRIICWIEFIFLISLYTDSEFALWSRKLRFIRLGLKIFVDGIPRYLFVKSYKL